MKLNQKLNYDKNIPLRIIMILLGTFIASVGINALYIPNNILAGGISGIAILLHLSFGWDISLCIVVLNVPIFIVAYKMINKEFIYYSLLGMASLSGFLVLTKGITFHSDEMLTTILLGGLLNGLGYGLVFKVNSSTGGNDIISKILHKRFSYSIATFNFAFNIFIIGLSIVFFGIDIATKTLAAMFVTSTTTKFILEGLNYKRTILIITNKEEEIYHAINTKMRRGCTVIDGMGSYTRKPQHIIYSVISISQLNQLKSIVCAIDHDALINVLESRMVIGKGFLDIDDNQ